jgi:hypothetical protein
MSANALKGDPRLSGSEGMPQPTSSGAKMDSMRVLWTVSEYRIGKGAVWGEQEARNMLFKPLDMDETSITFDRKTCSNVAFKKEMIETDDYLRKKYDTDRHFLGIEDDTLELFRTNCSLPGFAEYMRLQDSRLIICVNGVFFYFLPAVNY